jgi:hypothetical protein
LALPGGALLFTHHPVADEEQASDDENEENEEKSERFEEDDAVDGAQGSSNLAVPDAKRPRAGTPGGRGA